MNAAIYARKSTESAEGIERQIELSRAFCASKGWPVVAEPFVDNGVSGADFDRPGLNAFLKALDAKPRKFDALVIMESSRLGREQGETLALQGRIVKAGVRIFHYQDGQELRLRNAKDKLVASVGNFGAEDYREQIVDKTIDALDEKHMKGHATTSAPFGYRLVPQGIGQGDNGADKHTHVILERVETEAAIVRRIFDLSAEGRGDKQIADLLNKQDVATPRKLAAHERNGKQIVAKGWGRNEVARVLANEIYRGVSVRQSVKRGELRKELPGLVIVTEKQWDDVRVQKAQIAETYARTAEGRLLSKPEAGFKHLLSGILRCHECSGALGWQKGAYRCRQHDKADARCSNGAGIPAAAVERFARLAVVKMLLHGNPEAAADVIEERQARERAKVATHGDPYADAQAEAIRVEKEIGNLVALAASGNAPASILAAIAEKESRVAVLKATKPTVRQFDRAAFVAALPSIRAKYAALLREDGPEATTRAALRRLGISRLIAIPRPGSKVWDITGRLDLEKALAEVHAEDVADPDRLLTVEQVSGEDITVRIVAPAEPGPIAAPAAEAFCEVGSQGTLGERAG